MCLQGPRFEVVSAVNCVDTTFAGNDDTLLDHRAPPRVVFPQCRATADDVGCALVAETLATEVKHVETYAVHLLKRQHVVALLSVEVADNIVQSKWSISSSVKAAKPDVMS